MARKRSSKRPEEQSIYSCINPCTIAVGHDVGGNVVHKLYRTASEVELSEARLQDGGMDGDDCFLKVSPRSVVPHHFAPENDSAYDDREDQVNNPGKYIKEEMDMRIIAELMVDEGWFRDRMKEDDKGRNILDRLAIDLACDSIKEIMGDDASLIEDGADTARTKLFNELMTLGKDEKDTKKQVIAKLKAGGVKMFWGAELSALVNRVLEEELYEG